MSHSVQPHRRQPTRPHRPWDSPGKNTGVGCHFFLQCMKVKSESEVAQSYPTPSDPMDCSPPGSSIHGIFQARDWSGLPFKCYYIATCNTFFRVPFTKYQFIPLTKWLICCFVLLSYFVFLHYCFYSGNKSQYIVTESHYDPFSEGLHILVSLIMNTF